MTRIALMGATLSLVAYAERGGANDARRLLPSVAARGGANRTVAARGGANRTRRLLRALIDDDAFLSTLKSNRDAFAAAEPFPHAIIDGLFPNDVVQALVDEIPETDACDSAGTCFGRPGFEYKKAQTSDPAAFGPHTRALMEFLKSARFRRALEALTGFGEGRPGRGQLVTDPANEGAGLHVIGRGGYLKVHADFNGDGTLMRRVNTFLYLNPSWKDEYGGHLQLWNREMTDCTTIAPLVNRFVVFESNDYSYHGHPIPLDAPPGRARRSIATYYYSADRPAADCLLPRCVNDRERCSCEWHNTLWKNARCEACAGVSHAGAPGGCAKGPRARRRHAVPHDLGAMSNALHGRVSA